MSDKQQAILRKIKNLLAKSESTDNIHEAEAFATAANKLLVEYNLSMDDIKEDEGSSIDQVLVDAKTARPHVEGKWVIHLFNIIAKYNFCMMLTVNNGKCGLRIIGDKNNVEIVNYICIQLIHKIRRLARDQWKLYQQMGGTEKEGAFLRGFLIGAVLGVKDKLEEQRKAQMAQYPQMAGIVLHNQASIEKYLVNDKSIVRHKDGTIKQNKNRSLSSDDGVNKGFQEGKKIEINKGLGGTPPSTTKQLGTGK